MNKSVQLLNELTDKYDFRARMIANCIWPTERKPLVGPFGQGLALGLALGFVLGVAILGLVITGG